MEERGSGWGRAIMLMVWLAAGVVCFVPFARDTSPLDAVLLRVPGNQGNWWHVLVGAPFLLAYPMIWLRIRTQFGGGHLTRMAKRLIWGVVVLSMGGTTAVEAPFVLHLAGTSDWQRLVVLALGFGVMLCSLAMLLVWRRGIASGSACIAGMDAAYLANAALCLIVYSEATGSAWSRAGWIVSAVLVWPMGAELILLLARAVRGGIDRDAALV